MKKIHLRIGNCKPIKCRGTRGMSMLDLMITISIGAILLAAGVPTFSATANKNQIDTTASQLLVSLNVARSEAVKRRRSVRVCPSVDSSSCSTEDGAWNSGWLVFEDANSNNSADASEIIRLVNSLEPGLEIDVSDSMEVFVQFQPTGAAIGNSGTAGTFTVCHSNTSIRAQILRISAAGGVDVDNGVPADCDEEG